MSNLSHSFSKRSYGGNGFGTATHKSVYDDVFGGPPKFGMPTLAPRLEDYTEIFGGFHSARGASIPILDLPVVDGAELCFDVRSSRFDYGEVFGGFDGLDFAHSLDDFVRKSNGGNDSSGDDAWSPAESESPSSDTDPSAFSERSQSLINEDIYHPAAYIGQFDASFDEAHQRSKEKISNLAKNAAQSHAISGSNISPKVAVQTHGTSYDLKSNMGFDGGTEVRTIILPGKFELRRQERDCENYRRPGSDKIKPFVTVGDINLRTKPSRLPPPSRPPPVYADKKEPLTKLNLRVEDPSSYLAQTKDGSPLPIYDVEIDGSSSKSASATIRDPMGKTQATIGSAKEPIDVKEVLQTCPEMQPQNFTELVMENANKIVESISSCNDDKKAKSAEGSGETVALGEDKSILFKMDEEVPDLPEPDRYIDFTERSTNSRNGKGGGLSAQAFAWRQESEYFEVVEAGMPLKDIEQHNDETKFLQKDSNEFRNWVANEAFQQKEISGFKESKEAPKLHEKESKVEVSAKACDEGTRSKAVSRSGSQTVSPEIAKVDLKSCESEMNSKKIKTAKVPEEIWRLPNDSGGDGDDQTDDDIIVLEVNHKPRGYREKTGSTVMVDDSYAWILNESNLREDLEAEKDDEILSEPVKGAENKRTAILLGERKEQDQCREKENDRKTDEEVFGTNDREYMSKEVIDLKENEKRPAELKDYGKISEKSFETIQNRKSQELDGSTVTFLEFDIEESSTVTSISTISTPVDPCEHQGLSRCASDAKHKYFGGELANADQVTCATIESEGIKPFDSTDELNNDEHGACLSGGTGFGKVEATQAAVSCEQREDLKTKVEESEHGTDARVTNHLVKEDSLSANQDELQYAKCEDGIPHVNLENDGNEVSSDISNSSIKLDKEVSERSSKSECTKVKAYEQEQREKKTGGVELKFSHRISKDNLTSYQPREVSSENGKGTGASLTAKLRDRELPLRSGKNCFQQVKEKNMRENPAVRDNEIEARLQKQRELEHEHLRKIEEEKEREREREKDRMAIDRATLEAHNRLYADARQRSERASIDRATAEVRQRAVAEAREKLEKSSLEARERYLADKASAEARLKAERAAVERATLEARRRAFEKAMADRVLPEGRDRVERSVSDKFFTSRTDEFRQSSSFSNSGTSNALHYSYSSAHVGNDNDSPQRCKARLERYRRTAERAAKALEEKNSRDLVAQREQAERSRLAETLDAEVKRWSNGKEGNLRALLSTLQYILLPESGWQPIPLTEVITSAAVKKAYRKATLCVHPDKLQQRGASIQQKYVCEKVFDLLKEAWNTFNSEER